MPKFLTRAQVRAGDELTEILIPADEHSGGARAAGVAAYIDRRLRRSDRARAEATFVAGLARVDQLAHEAKGTGFLSLSPADREAIVTKMAAEEEAPKSEEGKFFAQLKRHDRPWLLHIEDRHPRRDGVQGQRSAGGVSGIDVSKPGA